jgi:hypothetical protein
MPNSGGVSTGLAKQVVSALFYYYSTTYTKLSTTEYTMSKTLKTLDEKIDFQQKKLDQMKAKKQQLEAREKSRLKAIERKKDTRRKILAGAFFLEYANNDAMSISINGKTLDEFLTRENDRLLFINQSPEENLK